MKAGKVSSRTQPQSAQRPCSAVSNEELIASALDAVADLRARHYRREHDVEKRVLDVVRLVQAGERIGLSSIEVSPEVRVLHDGTRALLFYKNMSSALLYLDRAVTNRKSITRQILSAAGLPVARGREAHSEDEVRDGFEALGGTAVVKPVLGSGGRGVTTDVQTAAEAAAAAAPILQSGRSVLVEEMVPAIDLRVCVVAGRATGATLRVPANVIGDGTSSIAELVEEKDALRESNDYARHQRVLLTPEKEQFLASRGLSANTVPEVGRRVFLHYVANISAGGDSYEILDRLHPEIADLAERAAALFPSALHAGIDLLVERFDAPISSQRAVVCEVNLNNEIPLHLYPLYGPSSPVDDIQVAAHWAKEARIPFSVWQKDTAPAPVQVDLAHLTDLIMAASDDTTTLGISAAAEDEHSGGPRNLDEACLRSALESASAPQTVSLDVDGRFVHVSEGSGTFLAERTGRTLIGGAVGADPDVLHRVARISGVPVMARHWIRATQKKKAVELAERPWRTWTLRYPGKGSTMHNVRVAGRADLDTVWERLPRTTPSRLVETPTDPACVLLMAGHQLICAQLLVPLTVTGDGRSTLAMLLDRERSRRTAHPVLKHYAGRWTVDELLVGTDAQEVLSEGHTLQLGRSPRLVDGASTIGLSTLPWPGLENQAARLMSAIGNPGIATFAFVPRRRSESEATWALWRFHSDPALALFRYPLGGPAYDPYPAVARHILSGESRRL